MNDFRSRLSATDTLLGFISAVDQAKREGKSTVAAYLDITGAFDNVLIAPILMRLSVWGITGKIQRFIHDFLSYRPIQVRVGKRLVMHDRYSAVFLKAAY